MVNTDITLQHPDVNSGVAVELNGATVNYGWKNIVQTQPVVGKHDIVEADYAGFENPQIVITGTINVNDTTPNTINQQFLTEFAICDTTNNNLVLSVSVGEGDGTYLKGRPSNGYGVGNTMTNTINVQVKSFSISFGVPESKEGSMWSYTIELVEVPSV